MTTPPKTITQTIHGRAVEFTSERPTESGYYLCMDEVCELARDWWMCQIEDGQIYYIEGGSGRLGDTDIIWWSAPLIPATELSRLKDECERLRGAADTMAEALTKTANYFESVGHLRHSKEYFRIVEEYKSLKGTQ